MNYFLLFLRLVHIIGGIFWVGSALTLTFFISPAAAVTAEAGQKFMGYLMTQSRLTLTMLVSAFASVLAGISLYWIDSAGFTSAWMQAGPGIGFGIGAVFAVIGLGFGIHVPLTTAALGRLAAQIQGAPTPEQMAKIASLRQRQMRDSRINAFCLIVATCFMATARYLSF